MDRTNLYRDQARDAAGLASAGSAPAARGRAGLEATVARACSRVAPLWPLDRFVAVNPFLGLTDQRFEEACATLRRVIGARMVMPRRFYQERIAAGAIDDADLQRALDGLDEQWPNLSGRSVAGLKHAARSMPVPALAGVATVADVLDRTNGTSHARFLVEEIAKWCAAYYDIGQSAWRMPWRSEPPWKAWRGFAAIDRNPETMGLKGFCAVLGRLPDTPMAAIAAMLDDIDVAPRMVDDYLHRALLNIGGWAAYLRYRAHEQELRGGADASLVDLLAIRIAWDWALHELHPEPRFRLAWTAAAAAGPSAGRIEDELETDLLLHEAFEHGFQRRLIGQLEGASRRSPDGHRSADRTAVQAAFCIDVRSEVYRRALEKAGDGIETIGFAGFFGFPIEYVPLGQEQEQGRAQCPILLAPRIRVRETVDGLAETEVEQIAERRTLHRRAVAAWKSFKGSAVSCFAFVEAAGLLFGVRLVTDALGVTRPAARPGTAALGRDVAERLAPSIAAHERCGHAFGIPEDQRVDIAEGALRGMSLTTGFARLVALCGHGGTTVNNPHAASLHCGACGGNSGEANARTSAAVLNDPLVREGLASRGIVVPDDTWFLGCLHDTTTDEVTIHDAHHVPASHAEDLARLRGGLEQASRSARRERARLLGIDPNLDTADARVLERSRDWSQPRPEWGLAGNAAFVAAPRARTQGLDLGGRVFLHSYDWRQDTGWNVLELIVTAPMIVANWINLQYYGSTVDNDAFGSGNKVLHNVAGALGVLQGNGGDLQVGLPWQAVHDGRHFVHEPLRLNVFIEAPEDAINATLGKHPDVRRLIDHRWLHLFRLAEEGRRVHRYVGGLTWREEILSQIDDG